MANVKILLAVFFILVTSRSLFFFGRWANILAHFLLADFGSFFFRANIGDSLGMGRVVVALDPLTRLDEQSGPTYWVWLLLY